jgi:hypothetical protein
MLAHCETGVRNVASVRPQTLTARQQVALACFLRVHLALASDQCGDVHLAVMDDDDHRQKRDHHPIANCGVDEHSFGPSFGMMNRMMMNESHQIHAAISLQCRRARTSDRWSRHGGRSTRSEQSTNSQRTIDAESSQSNSISTPTSEYTTRITNMPAHRMLMITVDANPCRHRDRQLRAASIGSRVASNVSNELIFITHHNHATSTLCEAMYAPHRTSASSRRSSEAGREPDSWEPLPLLTEHLLPASAFPAPMTTEPPVRAHSQLERCCQRCSRPWSRPCRRRA